MIKTSGLPIPAKITKARNDSISGQPPGNTSTIKFIEPIYIFRKTLNDLNNSVNHDSDLFNGFKGRARIFFCLLGK